MPNKQVVLHRWQVAAAFALLTTAFVVMGLVLGHDINQNHKAIRQIQTFRASRLEDTKHTDFILCKAANQVRAVNNRDRVTLLHAAATSSAATKAGEQLVAGIPASEPAARTIAQYLLALLKGSVASSAHEVAIRPRLPLIECAHLPSVVGPSTRAP